MGNLNCSGIASGLVKVISNYVNDYQQFRKDASKVFVNAIIPGKPDAEKQLNKLIDDAIYLQTKLFKSYGVVAGQGKGKIGPRHLTIPTKKVTGSLKTEREFVTALCPFDKVTVTTSMKSGNRLTKVKIAKATLKSTSLPTWRKRCLLFALSRPVS